MLGSLPFPSDILHGPPAYLLPRLHCLLCQLDPRPLVHRSTFLVYCPVPVADAAPRLSLPRRRVPAAGQLRSYFLFYILFPAISAPEIESIPPVASRLPASTSRSTPSPSLGSPRDTSTEPRSEGSLVRPEEERRLALQGLTSWLCGPGLTQPPTRLCGCVPPPVI